METRRKRFMILFSDKGPPGPENPEELRSLYVEHPESVTSAVDAFEFVEVYEWNVDRYTIMSADHLKNLAVGCWDKAAAVLGRSLGDC
jgi:hypothetical protein